MPFTRVHYHQSWHAPHQGQQSADGLDCCAGKADIVTHLVDVAALSTEIDLHVNYDERYRGRFDHAVKRPAIRLSFDFECFHVSTGTKLFADQSNRATSVPSRKYTIARNFGNTKIDAR